MTDRSGDDPTDSGARGERDDRRDARGGEMRDAPIVRARAAGGEMMRRDDGARGRGWPRAAGGRAVMTAALGVALLLASAFGVAAQGSFTPDERVGGPNEYTFESGPIVQTRAATGKAWTFAVGTDARAYVAVYEGVWGEWQTFADQPADFGWQPAVAEYNGVLYVVYPARSGKLWLNAHDGEQWLGWEDITDDYAFGCTPYANVADGKLWVYAVDGAGYLRYKTYDGAEWSSWAPVSADYPAEAYEAYAIEWGGYNNVFWTGTDGAIWWNRYDPSSGEWSGETALPGEPAFAYPPAVVAYAPENRLYAYGIGKAGVPYYNVFAEGEDWGGWTQAGGDLGVAATYQPSASVFADAQHVVVTGADGHAYYIAYDGAWSDWQDLGESYTYDPFTYTYADGLYLIHAAESRVVFYSAYVPA